MSNWNRLSLVTMGAGLCALIAAGVLAILSFAGVVGEDPYEGPPATVEVFSAPTREVLEVPAASPTAPPPTPSTAAIQTLSIPRFEVSAPVIVLGVGEDGVMQTPDGPTDVAWYDFSARPGFPVAGEGGNSVFAGHVDYYNYGPAVFWHLTDLERGDLVEVTLQDGTVYRYSVISREQFNAGTAPVEDIVGDTDREVITLITCGGIFDSAIGEYNDRIVVRAERIHEDAPPESVAAGAGQ